MGRNGYKCLHGLAEWQNRQDRDEGDELVTWRVFAAEDVHLQSQITPIRNFISNIIRILLYSNYVFINNA